jgi:hypothetical protein
MASTPIAAAAAARFARRTTAGAFVGAALAAMTVAALAGAAILLVARTIGHHQPPSPWWGLAAVPVLAFAALRARAERLPAAAAAAHVDQRLRLDGLLLSAGECGFDVAQERRLATGLAALPSVLPVVRWRQVLPRPLLAATVCAAVAALPAPPPELAPLPVPSAVQVQVDRLGEQLRDLARGHLPPETREELQAQQQELERQLADGKVPEWSAVDRLEDRLEREQLLQIAHEAALAKAAAESPSSPETIAELAGKVAAAAKALRPEQFAALPQAVRELLERARSDAPGFDPGKLGLDAAELQRLAAALAGAAGDPGGLEPSALEGAAFEDLQELLARHGVGEHEHGPECAGGH